MKIRLIVLAIATSVGYLNAQNMVENGDFENFTKKPKTKGMISMAEHWYSPTNAQADLLVPAAKSEDIRVPKNQFGDEKPRKGKNYAGVMMYSYREKLPRTYISTTLTNPMTKGKWYCIRFHVSLGDLAKYAVNNIGIYVSEDS